MRARAQQGMLIAVGLVVMLGGSSVALAACAICEKAGDPNATYLQKSGTTLVRGAANTLLGWTELIRQPVDEAKAGGNVLVGIGKGVGQGVKRTLAGVGEVVTFWTPKINNEYIHFASDCPICMTKQ